MPNPARDKNGIPILEGNRVRLDGDRFGTAEVILPSGRIRVAFDDGHTENIDAKHLEVER